MLARVAIPHLAAIISIVLSLVLADPGPGPAALLFGFVGMFALVIAAIIDVRLIRQHVKTFKLGDAGRVAIERYMHDLISNAGSVAIFTRDMTWASGDIQEKLKSKAARNELTVVMQKSTIQSGELVAAGASVYYYSDDLNIPINTRFTLINLDSQNVELALGRTKGGGHKITRHHEQDDPVLLLAKDMLTICRQTLTPAVASS